MGTANKIRRVAFLFLLCLSSASFACTICHSGDPAVVTNFGGSYGENLAGSMDSKWVLALEGKSRTAESTGESMRHSELAISVWKKLGSKFSGYARLPFTETCMKVAGSPTETATGIGDAIVMAGFDASLKSAGFTTMISAGIKLPTGENSRSSTTASAHGFRSPDRALDHDVNSSRNELSQLGSGSVDGIAMLSWTRSAKTQWLISTGVRVNGENSYHYQYGNVFWLESSAYHSIVGKLAGGAGLRFRVSERDTDNKLDMSNTGGSLTSALLDLNYRLSQYLFVRGNAAFPLINDLNGSLSETPVYILGLATML